MMKNVLGVLLLFTAGILPIRAQQINLDPVTVSTSILEKRASETGRNLTVIRGEDLRNLPVSSIDEILRYLPGLEIQARGPMGAQSDIVLRGGTFQQVLVVLDGLRLNDPTTGHFNSYIPISPSEISRIEILKGASSSIYGSEAVGGVVSVITKTFESSSKADESFLEGGLAAGQYGLWNGQLGGYLHKDKLRVSGGILSNNASGQELRGTKGYFHNHTASVSARYQLAANTHVAYRASFDRRDFAAQNFYTAFVSDTATEKVTGWWQQLEIGHTGKSSALTLKAGLKSAVDEYLYNPVSVANKNTSGLGQLLLTWSRQWSDHTDFVAGVNYQQRKIRSNDRGNHEIQQVAPFVAASHRIGNLNIHPSLRLDWRESSSAELVPQLNLSYKLASWQLRASVGKTIRDPDFTERFNNYNKKLVTGGSVGNPDLVPEKSLSYEVGFDYFHNTNWKISATGFQRHQRDLIDYVPTSFADMPRKENLSPTGSFALAENIARVVTRGVEADLQYQYAWNKKNRLNGMLGITLLDSEQSVAKPSFYLSSHAKLLVNTSVSYKTGRFFGSLNGLYKKREPRQENALLTRVEKTYFVLNAQAGLDVIVDKLSLFIQVDNLTDKRYSDLLGATMPGRWWRAGIKFRY
ncbi:TonB-dependent vitamin B12 receptor [Ravibacter arvi]|uniref:TonB-dependent vitamin B12 receptor n=1 Tax=Ravibacter arvi TaxID=2051041 RepID=A0ABP8LPE2_9BACT